MRLASGYLWLLAGLLALSVWLFYSSVLRPPAAPGEPGAAFWRWIRWRNQVGLALLVLVVVPLAAFALWRAGRVQSEVGQLVEPYPNATAAVYVPDLDADDSSRDYLVETDDPASSVVAFYTAPEHREGWELVASGDTMVHLERPGQRLFVVVTEQLDTTTIGYLVSSE